MPRQAARIIFTARGRYSSMPVEPNPQLHPARPIHYQIRVKGHLGEQWRDWFGGLNITICENGETLLSGAVADQAALYGLLKKVRDLGMELISVVRLEAGEADTV